METTEGNNTPKRKIVTAKVKKSGDGVKRFVKPAYSQAVKELNASLIKESLRQNVRLVLEDDHNQPVLDVFNCLNPEGKLYPKARILKPFLETCHYGEPLKVAIKHRGNIIGESGLRKLERECRDSYAERVEARRRGVTPRRYVKVQCANCGYINEVDLVGYGN